MIAFFLGLLGFKRADPELPKTKAELVAIIKAEVVRFLSTVPRGEE